MKIAIHQSKGSYSDYWITFCEKNNISLKIVDCYDSNIISQLDDCIGVMWHWDLNDYKAALFARQLGISLEKKGLKLFPDVNTSWHYDDKLGQKYLLEAVGAPMVKTYVFYSEFDALKWIIDTTFPKVFKLRNGAGSINVKLVKTKDAARKIIYKAFGKGFSHYDRISLLKDKIWLCRKDNKLTSLIELLSSIKRLFIPTEVERFSYNQKGYVYFQDFIPNNEYDYRIKVIGDYCWGFRRKVRKNDFRASGSGILDFDITKIPLEMIQTAFILSKKLNFQSIAYDFVIDQKEHPLVIEMSYCFGFDEREFTNGYWTSDLIYHEKSFNPFNEMIINFLNKCNR